METIIKHRNINRGRVLILIIAFVAAMLFSGAWVSAADTDTSSDEIAIADFVPETPQKNTTQTPHGVSSPVAVTMPVLVPSQTNVQPIPPASSVVSAAVSAKPQPTAPIRSTDDRLQVTACVDKALITIGDSIKYSITIVHDESVTLIPLDIATTLGGFAVKDFGRTESKKIGKTKKQESFWYTLDTYVVGAYIIPPITVRGTDANGKQVSVTAPEIFIEVKSVISDKDTARDIRDIKPPVSIPLNKKFIGLISGITACVLLCVGAAVYWFCFRKRQAAVAPCIPPHERAYRELDRISSLDLIGKGEIKEYYFLITTCLRSYIEERFSIAALEKTTEEFLAEVLDLHILNVEQKNIVSRFLAHCDFVKFAKYSPNTAEIDQTFETVRRFVDETKPAAAQMSESSDDEDES